MPSPSVSVFASFGSKSSGKPSPSASARLSIGIDQIRDAIAIGIAAADLIDVAGVIDAVEIAVGAIVENAIAVHVRIRTVRDAVAVGIGVVVVRIVNVRQTIVVGVGDCE